MNLDRTFQETHLRNVTRRHFLERGSLGLGGLALSTLFGRRADATAVRTNPARDLARPFAVRAPHFPAKAKRVIYLHMAGAPSQLELFDWKPELAKLDGKKCPQSFLEGKRFAFIKGVPDMLGPQAKFAQHGECGAWVSERLPEFAQHVDDVAFLKAVHTDQFNHAPAQLFIHTGSAQFGRPSLGAWAAYGLGSENQDLPGFIVLLSGGKTPDAGKSVWGSGFLPTVYQGVQCRTSGEPILFSQNPPGIDRDLRRRTIDVINRINEEEYAVANDPEIATRIAQYEMAFRMQMSVPDAMDIQKESPETLAQYGAEAGKNSFANNCLLARRLAERGVRFIQLYDWGWDSHGSQKSEALLDGFVQKTQSIDRPIAALLGDLRQRGLLDDTLVIWGGEFGRTPMMENRGGTNNPFKGRDHHPFAYTMWLAGGGVRAGTTIGETDDLGYYPIKDPVGIHDLQATILHLLGFDHERLTYFFQGRDYRLTDVRGKVVESLLA